MHPQLCKARFDEDLAALDEELCAFRRWTVFEKSYPLLDVGFTSAQGKQLRLRANCEAWNEQPPSIELLDWEGRALTAVPASTTNIFNGTAHPSTGKFFICMRGVREYHTHFSHTNDPWAPLSTQAEYRLGEIITQLWRGWKGANP
jgi:hypothetical protein